METKETYELNGMVKIKVYENRKETGYTNIMIYNELGEHFVFGIDMCSQCCEDYELNIDERYKNFKAPNGIILVVYFDEDDYGEGGKLIFHVIDKTNKKHNKMIFSFSNYHNGYYSHEVYLRRNEYIWKKLL